MKKKILVIVAIVAMMIMGISCGVDKSEASNVDDVSNVSIEKENVDTEGVMADIAINIEGIVVEVDENKVALDTGKIVIITEKTVFETQDIGEIEEIENRIEIGNFIQGYTSDDLDVDEVVADVISRNEKMQISSKIAINIEGVVVAIDENVITLDNGQKFIVNEETAFETQVEGDINSPMRREVNSVFEIGNFVQGFTMDDLNQEMVVALVISCNRVL